jgi:pimeloyl-ACP methyl ester carboxylesterase
MRKIWIALVVMVLGVSCFGLGLVFALWLDSEEPTAEVTTTVPRSAPSSTAIPEVTATVPRNEPSGATITWHTCNDKSIDSEDSDLFDCSTVDVPLDYAQPDGEKISIAVIRLRASERRTGAILYNPGGPGASGFDYVAGMGQTYVDELQLEEFDFVGFDPRGVDRSGGLRCQTDKEIDKYMYPDTTPDTPEEEAFLQAAYDSFAAACKVKYGAKLQFYSTANTARDMDMIRIAMGDEKIGYLGVSYGTYLGAVYASMFPDRVRSMVLDSAYDPKGDSIEERYMTQMRGFEKAMNNWIAWCEKEARCAFHSSDVGARWDALYTKLDNQPVAGKDGRLANQEVLDTATRSALYSESRWDDLAQALADVEAGDAEGVWYLADSYNDRQDDGTYLTSNQSQSVIACASGILYDAVPNADELLKKMQTEAPRMSMGATAKQLAAPSDCRVYMDVMPIAAVEYAGAAPVLIIGGENDPATPMRWSTKMHDKMGPNAALLTYSGEGHGQVLEAKCVSEAAVAVLTTNELPADGSKCDPDPDVIAPIWWKLVPGAVSDAVVLDAMVMHDATGIKTSKAFLQAWAVPGTNQKDLLAEYEATMETAGFTNPDDPSEISGGLLKYFCDGNDCVGVLVLDPAALADAEWDSVRESVPAKHCLVVYLYFPE